MTPKSAGRKKIRGRENAEPEEQESAELRHNDLLITAIGASAGGIEAFTELISHLPADTGMVFVLVQHLDPKHHSILTELLAKKTSMPVKEVTDGMPIEGNHVYVIPPNATMSISNHTLLLSPREESRGVHMSIDHFMRTLAEKQGNRAIGVILSGSGTDGTLGMAEIQAKLEQELAAAREYLQSVIETQEATNEELQSVNEELTTVNDELRNRNLEITQANNDLTNLFASLDVAVVMIGSDLTIRRFTPEAQKFLGLIPADVGRPLLNINPTIDIPDFQSLVLQVMATFRPIERELQDAKGGRFLLRILPFRTMENKIDGAVITIIAIQAEVLPNAAN